MSCYPNLRQSSALDQMEAAIEAGQAAFERVEETLSKIGHEDWSAYLRVVRAFLKIRTGRLSHPLSWEDYCRKRWQYSSSRIDREIRRAEVITDLLDGCFVPNCHESKTAVMPNEAQARELFPVPSEHRAGVWDDAQRSAAAAGKPRASAIDVKEAARRAGLDPAKYTKTPTPRPPADPRKTALAQIRSAVRRIAFARGRLDAGEQEQWDEVLDLAQRLLDSQEAA